MGPREDPWQSSERPSKAAGRVLRVSRVLRLLLRCALEVVAMITEVITMLPKLQKACLLKLL